MVLIEPEFNFGLPIWYCGERDSELTLHFYHLKEWQLNTQIQSDIVSVHLNLQTKRSIFKRTEHYLLDDMDISKVNDVPNVYFRKVTLVEV